MGKLHQLVATIQDKKSGAISALKALEARFGVKGLTDGLARTYRPRQEGGETLPPEDKGIQLDVLSELQQLLPTLIDRLDNVAAQELTNCSAKANIEIDDKPIVPDVPTYILFDLEKFFTEFLKLVEKMPVLDPAERWDRDEATDSYRSKPSQVSRAKKVFRNHVKAEATDKHPAQVEVYTEDIPIGDWTVTKFSGAVPLSYKNDLTARVKKLLEAIKVAREGANSINVQKFDLGKAIFGYLLPEMQ